MIYDKMYPNVKLFISYGGISGVYEAVDAGVPVLGFPFFYDQPRNIDNLVNAGLAISMDLLSVTKNTSLNAVLEIINNAKYKKKIPKSLPNGLKTNPCHLQNLWFIGRSMFYVIKKHLIENLTLLILNGINIFWLM